MTSFCLIKLDRNSEAAEIITEYKNQKPQDTTTCKYMVAVYNNLGMFCEATVLLEGILTIFPSKKELQE